MSDAADNGFKDGTGDLDPLPNAADTQDAAHNPNIQDSPRLVLKDSGSTSRVDSPSDSNTECLVDDVSLPQELIAEILVCLPVRSLLRFKCVSKPWLSLISDPLFIRYHFSKSSSLEADGLNLELLFATKDTMKKCSLYSALHEAHPPTDVSAIDSTVWNIMPIVGIIHGLVCLNLGGTDLSVWNPALNKIKHFNFSPEAPSSLKCFFSFGYDESNDDYKVVCLQIVRGDDRVYKAEVFIFSLKADSWRRVDQIRGPYLLQNPGVYANGKIYWSGYVFPTPAWKHFSLDMSSDRLVEVQPPEYDAGEHSLEMGVSGGRPFVLCDYYTRKRVDLWWLDTHGVEESWCKVVSIPYTDFNHGRSWFFYRVLCISSNGEIVFGNGDGLLVYDWKKKMYRHIKLFVDLSSRWAVAAYVESLIWPNYA